MSSNTKIELPLHVMTAQLVQVMMKLAGGPYDKTLMALSSEKKVPIDPTQPASESNRWHMDWGKLRPKFERGHDPMSGYLMFHDVMEQQHRWFYIPELSDSTTDCKLVYPGSTPLAVAMGIRLVTFFGGLTVANSDIETSAMLRVSNRRAQFPARKPDQDSNSRWYQFQNALAALTPLTAAELRAGAQHSCYGFAEREQLLLQFLESIETRRDLDSVLPEGQPAARSKRRL